MLRLFSGILLFALLALWGCKGPAALPGDPADFPLAQGEFLYVVEGDLKTDAQGTSFFYRAGDNVVVYLGDRYDNPRLELAYEETQSNDLGTFPIRQNTEYGGYVMKYVNGEENYWQQSGDLEITYSSPDTIIGRMDRIELATPSADTFKVIQITGRFTAI